MPKIIMPKIRLLHLLLAGTFSFLVGANGQYTQDLVGVYAPGYIFDPGVDENHVDRSARAAPNDLGTMSEAFEFAHANNAGGTFSFPTTMGSGHQTEFHGRFGENLAKQVRFTSNHLMQSIGYPSGSFYPISGPYGITQNANSIGHSFTFSVTDAAGNPLLGEYIQSVGVVLLSRNATGGYPLDVRVTASFDDSTSTSETITLGTPRGTDDVFVGFTAAAGVGISSLQFESFAIGTTDPVSSRIGLDDLGVVVIPEPGHAGILFASIAIAAGLLSRRKKAKFYGKAGKTVQTPERG